MLCTGVHSYQPSPAHTDTATAECLQPRSCILPIGLLFAGTLWTGNAAYLYLSVSFIQMLKVCLVQHWTLQPKTCDASVVNLWLLAIHSFTTNCHVQASMPMVVFVVGVLFGTEKFTVGTGLNMVVVGTGIAIASYGGFGPGSVSGQTHASPHSRSKAAGCSFTPRMSTSGSHFHSCACAR